MLPLSIVTTGSLEMKIADARFVKATSTECPAGFADTAVTIAP